MGTQRTYGKKTDRSKASNVSLAQLSAFDDETEDLKVIVETPKGSHNKFTYDQEQGLFKLSSVLPAGAAFPFDFGFIPSTLGGDGDPLDVLVLMDEPAFPGCLIMARLIGVIKADQIEEGKTERNDRLIAVAVKSRIHQDVKTLSDLSDQLLGEVKHFFVSYKEAKGKEFKPLGYSGPKRARKIVDKAMRKYSAANGRKK